MKFRLGYDTRSLRSALFMRAIDLLRPWHRAQPFEWADSVVVSSVAGLGDLFIHLPLIAGIVARHPGTRVALRPSMTDLGRRCGWDVFPFDNALAELFKTPTKVRPLELLAQIHAARRTAPALWIDLSANALNAALIKLTGARRLAARITRGGRSFTDHALPHDLGESEYANRRRTAAHLDCALDFSVFARLLSPSPQPGAAVLAITTACRWRSWPLSRFAAIARAFPRTRFALVGLAGEVPAEERTALAELLACSNVVDLLDRLRLDELIGLVAHAPAVVTNDTSVAHIAGAYARPGALLFGPTPQAYLPESAESFRVFHDRTYPYYPCIQWRCENPANWCMASITAEEVIAHLATLLR